jgi:O-6-methylguanine DNA methyltransferase
MSITDQLARLGEVSAPSTLLPAVLAAVAGDQYGLLGEEVWPLWIAWNRDGVAAVMRADQNDEAVFTGWFRKEFGRPLRRATSVPAGLRRSRRYDLGEQTPFERAVLLKTAQIPRGQVRTYSWVAREIGHPAAVRAVGTALANNPIPVLIPCHRVIRTDGIIGNYGAGGTEAKKQILSAEGVDPAEMERLARARVRFFGSRTTHIFCLPTCRHARRVQPRYQLEFHSEGEARAKGYRPCKVCRPAPALAG